MPRLVHFQKPADSPAPAAQPGLELTMKAGAAAHGQVMRRWQASAHRVVVQEKELSQQIALLSKELEKLKYDLGDLMDSKFDGMTRNMEQRVSEM